MLMIYGRTQPQGRVVLSWILTARDTCPVRGIVCNRGPVSAFFGGAAGRTNPRSRFWCSFPRSFCQIWRMLSLDRS